MQGSPNASKAMQLGICAAVFTASPVRGGCQSKDGN
jgi:hypothetical protein